MKSKSNIIEVTQDFEIIPLEKGEAYTILVREWDAIRRKVTLIGDRPNIYHSVGLVFLGAAVSTLIQCLAGNFPKTEGVAISTPHIISWAAFAVLLIVGIVCFVLGREKRKVQAAKTGEVIETMELIEERFKKQEEITAPAMAPLLMKNGTDKEFLAFLFSKNRAVANVLRECKISFQGNTVYINISSESLAEGYFDDPDHYEQLLDYTKDFFENEEIKVSISYEK